MNQPTVTAPQLPVPIRNVRVMVADTPHMVEEDQVVVGSAADVGLVIQDPMVSRYHVELTRCEGGVRVRDLGSTNGTYIGDVRIHDAVLQPGSRITVGQTTLFIQDGQVAVHDAADIDIPDIVGQSPAVRRIKRMIHQLAQSTVSVLIEGETGTGKELVARALHDRGPRRDQPFVTVDCGSMPATVIASELFGHERGAFTGADRQRIGAFEQANGGTVFLDEIGELPLPVQSVLLGALERRRFRRVGGDREIEVDVRVVAATNRDLRKEVNQGTYRSDVYFRLAVARLVLPPLRERPEDVPLLVRHFVLTALGTDQPFPFTTGTLQTLSSAPWGGNIRELRNVVEGALAMGQLTMPSSGSTDATGAANVLDRSPMISVDNIEPYRQARADAIEQFEQQYLSTLIRLTEGNASQASRVAQMDRSHLLNLLKKHGLR